MATMEELYQQYLLTQPRIGGSQNRYRDLISQMRPFANPYPGSTGLLAGAAATSSRPPANNPLGTYITDGGLGGTTVDGVDQNMGTANPSWDAMTDAEKASFYENNPGFAKATQIGQSIIGITKLGLLQALLDPDKVNREGLIRQGFDFNAYQKARDEFRETELKYAREQEAIEQARVAEAEAVAREVNNIQAGLDVAAEAESAARGVNNVQAGLAVAAEAEAAAREADRGNWFAGVQQQIAANQAASLASAIALSEDRQAANNAAAEGAIGSYGGGSFAEQDAINAAIAQSISDQSGANYGGYDTSYGTGDTSGGFGEGQYAKGGKVIKAHLKGPDPKGPDEGYGALLGGEFVIKKSAVKKYGAGLLGMINDGKIPVQKMKSLLG